MRVVVVGGGLTGLATALGLTRAGHDVQLFEASGRAGGAVASIERDGFVMEQGAGSLRGAHRDVYQLLADAGVTDAGVKTDAGAAEAGSVEAHDAADEEWTAGEPAPSGSPERLVVVGSRALGWPARAPEHLETIRLDNPK